MSDYGRNVANDDQVREWAKTLRAERVLADDLAADLTSTSDYATRLMNFIIDHIRKRYTADECGHILEMRPETDRVLARYREARGR
jgi:hypothetical protein